MEALEKNLEQLLNAKGSEDQEIENIKEKLAIGKFFEFSKFLIPKNRKTKLFKTSEESLKKLKDEVKSNKR